MATTTIKSGIRIQPFAILMALVMAAGLIFGITLTQKTASIRSKATNTGPVLTLIPAQQHLAMGETAQFAVTLNTNGKSVSVAQIEISYDPTALQNVTFSKGTILPVTLQNAAVTNRKITVTVGAQPGHPFTGTGGILGTITVKAKAEKESTLSFTENTIVLVTTQRTDALASKTGATIFAPSSSGTPPPTPPGSSSTPTLQPSPTSGPTPTGGAINCDQTCSSFKNVRILTTCINLCRDINNGISQCPGACDTVPSEFKNGCLASLCAD